MMELHATAAGGGEMEAKTSASANMIETLDRLGVSKQVTRLTCSPGLWSAYYLERHRSAAARASRSPTAARGSSTRTSHGCWTRLGGMRGRRQSLP